MCASIFWSLFTCILIYCSICVVAPNPEKGLILTTITKQIEEISSSDGDKICYECLIACPPISSQQENFNTKNSISKNSLFLQKAYGDEVLAKDMFADLNVCNQAFKPSLLYDWSTDSYELGYELYYEEGQLKNTLENDEFPIEHLQRPEVSTTLPAKDNENQSQPAISSVTESESDKNAEINSPEPKMLSYWINILTIKMDPSKYQIRIIVYPFTVNNYPTMEECKNYDVGIEFYKSSKEVNFFFSEKNPAETFHLPQLERIQVTPMTYFYTEAAKLATCTYVNTVPVWSSIANGQLKTIDQYLSAMFKKWPLNIDIVFGVSDVITLNTNQIAVEKGNVPSDPNDESELLRLPKIFYRIVGHHIHIPSNVDDANDPKDIKIGENDENDDVNIADEDDDGDIKSYYIAVIVHNDPNATETDRICSQQKNLDDEWKFITNYNSKIGMSYTCVLNNEINEKLGAYEEIPDDSANILYLSQFFHYDESLSSTDVTNIVHDEKKKLFG